MPNALTREWTSLKKGSPGRRFKDRYAAAREARKKGGWSQHLSRIVRLFLAAVSLAIAVVLMFIPGPAVLFYFIAGGLLAAESKLIARFLDWVELRARAFGRWAKRHWKKMPLAGKVAVVTIGTVITAGAAWLMYRLMTR